MYRKKNQVMEIAICLMDAVVVLFCLLVAGMIRYQNFGEIVARENLRGQCCVLLILHVTAYYFMKVYDGFFKRGRYNELLLSVKYNLILIAGASLLSFGMKSVIFKSRLVMGYFFVINTVMICLIHIFIRNREKVFRWSRRRVTNLLVVTTADRALDIVRCFQRSKETTWNIAGLILLDEKKLQKEIPEVPVISGTADDYLEYATLNVVDEVFIQVDTIQRRESFLKNMILEFEKMGIVVNLNLDLFDLGLVGEKRIYNLEQYHVIAFSSRLFDYRMVWVKRIMDIAGALVGLLLTVIAGIILAPFLLLESPGPLIFCQKRVGVNGRIFNFYKFRSMYADAEELKKELIEQN